MTVNQKIKLCLNLFKNLINKMQKSSSVKSTIFKRNFGKRSRNQMKFKQNLGKKSSCGHIINITRYEQKSLLNDKCPRLTENPRKF
mmetsp:Transcript_9909/g.15952  ORF Transcript_9909/g.15952 Transcript_9909/m.15952 type:complete len:86 (+) Transcript_9909:986-1243(+)